MDPEAGDLGCNRFQHFANCVTLGSKQSLSLSFFVCKMEKRKLTWEETL